MPQFEVVVERTLYVTLEIDAATKEEAEKLAKQQIATNYEDIYDWFDYTPFDVNYNVIPGDRK
jgi:hypothetical protein